MNIYFSGIGGVGLGPLAEIAHDAGYLVVGSDPQTSLETAELQQRGIVISQLQDGKFLYEQQQKQPFDWFIYTSALPDNHPELVMAKKLGIRTAKRDELLSYIIKDKKLDLIAVAGTHGKTTTTSMIVWALKQLGIPVSYSIGTTIKFGPSGKFDPESHYFVYECDEFDRNFLHFEPFLSIIPSIDYDHPDTYPTKADYATAFNTFIQQSKTCITWQQNLSDPSVIDSAKTHLELLDKHNQSILDKITKFKIPGQQNRENAYLALTALQDYLGFDGDKVIAALNSFPGTDRRFEKLADNLYTDYGHHPTEIAATLQLARELSDHVVLVYQPHQNVRQFSLREQYTNQFELAETVYWLPTYLTREDPKLPILKPTDLIQNVTNKDHVKIATFGSELWQAIQAERQAGHLVLVMGAGEVDGWLRQQLKAAA